MPEMDGYDLARSIRTAEGGDGGGHTPIIACTGNVLEGEAENCLAAGMDDYLAKPVELSLLLRALDRWLPLPLAPAAGVGHTPPIDCAKLAELSLGDAAFERELLADFRGAADEDAGKLGSALEAGNSAEIARISHRIKGASRTVGATTLAALSERMENAGRANDRAAIGAATGPLFAELERLREHLENF